MGEVEQYLIDTYDIDNEHQVRKSITCKDGFFISVQGGTKFHYCNPRMKINSYEEVELGFPSEEDELIMEYAEDKDRPTETVYPWVPIKIVEQLIQKHGGIEK